MDTLPDEMVSRVFELGADRAPEFVGVMRLVCRRFDRIALASPRLWTRVVVNDRTLPGAFLRASRAGSVPLQLRIDLDSGKIAHPLTAILQLCRRYDSLSLKSKCQGMFSELVSQLRCAPLGLRDLRLVYDAVPAPVWDDVSVMARLTLPHLTSLYMRRVNMPLPYTPKLRSLALYGESATLRDSVWLHVMRTCPLLEKVERLTRPYNSPPRPPCKCPAPDPVGMFRLTHLLLYTRTEHELLFAILSVYAPQLETLVVAGQEGWNLQALVLGAHLHPSLRKLKTFGIVLPDTARTLSHLSTLTHLVAKDLPNYDNGILETLLGNASKVEETLLLPNLLCLTLNADHTGNKRDLAPLRAARSKRGAPLLSFESGAATAPSV